MLRPLLVQCFGEASLFVRQGFGQVPGIGEKGASCRELAPQLRGTTLDVEFVTSRELLGYFGDALAHLGLLYASRTLAFDLADPLVICRCSLGI